MLVISNWPCFRRHRRVRAECLLTFWGMRTMVYKAYAFVIEVWRKAMWVVVVKGQSK